MNELLVIIRNKLNRFFYKQILKRIFFRIDPERVHDRMNLNGQLLGKFLITRKLASLLFSYSNKSLEQNILGINFKNPIGLSAGFDKDANLTDILPYIGFGFAEVGSITGEPCQGNPKPRLWRLKKSSALVVDYGLNNEGSIKISKKLQAKTFVIPIGTNIAKTNSKKTVAITAGINDYLKAFRQFTEIGSYFTINISCPNAYGGQPFTDSVRLEALLTKLDEILTKKPVFLKLSPDLAKTEVDRIIKTAQQHRVAGFICSNLTKRRNSSKIIERTIPGTGGISGKVVEDLANDLIAYIYHKTNRKFIIIGCGGVFSAEDAYKKIKFGASLVQLITGAIYEGPQLISEINQGLVSLLRKDGLKNISEAIGLESRMVRS